MTLEEFQNELKNLVERANKDSDKEVQSMAKLLMVMRIAILVDDIFLQQYIDQMAKESRQFLSDLEKHI